jgi:hypothetical protein
MQQQILVVVAVAEDLMDLQAVTVDLEVQALLLFLMLAHKEEQAVLLHHLVETPFIHLQLAVLIQPN